MGVRAPYTWAMNKTSHGRKGFDPLAYDLIAVIDTRPHEDEDEVLEVGSRFDTERRQPLTDEGRELIQKRDDEGRWACDHCGKSLSAIRFVAYAVHRDSGDVVAFGHICGKDLGYEDAFALAIAHARRAEQTAKETAKRNAERDAWAAAHPVENDILDAYKTEFDEGFGGHYGSEFLASLVRARRLYGALSDKQTAAIVDAETNRMKWGAEREAREVEDAERPNLDPGTGRQEWTGEVVAAKFQDNDFGGKFVMTVRLADGNLIWGTIPNNILENVQELKGRTVTFTATVEVSDRDPHFGFYKRPTGARKDG